MERIIRSLEINERMVEIITRGNFSRMVASPFLDFLSIFLVNLFSEFEEQFGLKILSWEIIDEGENGKPILIHHEPKEKAKVARPCHEYETDLDNPEIKL